MAEQKALAIIGGVISEVPATDTIRGTGGSTSSIVGQAVVPFATFLNEDTVTVSGQSGLSSTSKIVAQIYATNDDVYAQDWYAPIIRNITATSFDVVARCDIGTFKGNVTVNWNRTG